MAGLPGAPVTASGSEPGHPFRGNQWTEISGLDAKKLLKPSEKPGSHDPAKFIKDTDRFKVGKVALSDISKSESGAAYDSTVNMDRAKDYASRQGSFPPILIGEKRVSGLHNVHDGGHRTTAARLRGDTHIAALIKIRSSESNLLSAVRAERLARRVEKVLAAAQFDESKHPRGEHGHFATKEERDVALAQIKEHGAKLKWFSDKGGLTGLEAAEYKRISKMAHDLRFKTARNLPAEKLKLKSSEERQSTLVPETIVSIRDDLLKNKAAYDAIMAATDGVHFNADTPVDDIVDGRSKEISFREFYDIFAGSRRALAAQYGATVKLYRSVGKQKPKPTTNWATTREFAAMFGDNVVEKEIPVENIIAANVGLGGNYHELIVGEPPTTVSAFDLGDDFAVRAASGAFAAGHKFWGNQWSEHAKDAANDPVGEPSGKIKHAVLVIAGKRFKGPSHFQALMVAMDAGHSVDNAEDIQDQGFETESGHFLNRTQAAKYVEKPRTGPGSSQLQSEDLQLVAAGGRLYTQDRVQAISENGSPHAANPLPDVKSVAKAVIRDAGGKVLLIRDAKSGGWDIPGGHLLEGENAATGLMREIYEETGLVPFQSVFRKQQGNAALFDSEVSGNEPHVTLSNEHTEYRWVQEGKAKDLASFWMGGYGDHDAVRAEAQRAVARAVNHIVVLAEAEELSKKRKDDDEFFLLASTIFVAALAEAYGQAARQLAINAAGQDGGESLTQREETEYGASRQEFLENFARDVRERIRTEAARGRTHGEADQELVSRVRREGDEINTGAGKVVAETEAQAIYGHAQLRALRRAGYKTAYWVTVGDERVRDSHTRCEAAGAVRIGDKFPNGLMYPGDPAGGPEEVVNCRCWLEGASRREPAKEAK